MNDSIKKKFLIIDGHSLAYRAFYAIKATLTAPDGTPTNAITGFMNMFSMAQDKINPACCVAVFDAPAPTFRHELLPQYKANRKPSPDEFRAQVPVLQELLRALGCPVLSISGVEADDVIGSLALASVKAGHQAVILSSDKDLMQVLNTDMIMLRPIKSGVSQAELFDAADFEREHGYPASCVPDFLALTGDSSDNVPGVPGIGEKTATTLISRWHTIEAIYDALAESPKAVQKKLAAVDRETVIRMRELIRLKLDVPVDLDACLNFQGDTVKAIALAGSLGLSRLLRRLTATQQDATEPQAGAKASAKVKVKNETQLDGKAIASAFAAEIRANDPDWLTAQPVSLSKLSSLMKNTANTELALAFAPPSVIAETESPQLSLAFASQSNSLDENKFQIAMMSRSGEVCSCTDVTLDELETFLGGLDCNTRMITQDYKTFLKANVIPNNTRLDIAWDLRTAYYLLHPDITERAFPLLIPDEIAPAPALFALKNKLDIQVQAHENLSAIMTQLDLPLLPALDRMERHGVRLDPNKFAALQSELKDRITELERELQDINRAAGGDGELNLNSPVQIAALLFERLGLPPDNSKKGKLGYSTSADVLEHLTRSLPEPDNKAPSLILEYRELSKMLTGFVIPLQKAAARDENIIHTSFEAAFTGTGRLSSRDPNLQNIPAFGTWAERIKAGLVPVHENNVFVAADYSQIELRVLAHMSQEEKLLDAFRNGRDIHRETASWVFDKTPDDVTPELRRKAKMINFGLLYGMSSFGLAERLDIPRSEASDIMKRYFEALPNVKDFLDNIVKNAEAEGCTRTIDGRIRPVRDLTDYMNVTSKSALKRALINSPIQGTAADIARRAVINFDLQFANDPDVNLFLQVHDSLVCECPSSRADEVGETLSKIMQDTAKETLPSIGAEATVKTGNSLALI